MQTTASVEIDRPIEDVFLLTIDHVPEWSKIVVEDEILEESPDGVGTTFRTVTADRGRRMVFHGVVTRQEVPFVQGIKLTGEIFDIDCEYTFEDLYPRTRVTQTSRITGKGLFKMILMLFGGLMSRSGCQAAQRELQNLKRFCEEFNGEPAG